MSINAQETSKQAYHELVGVGQKQQVILATLQLHGPKTDKQLAFYTQWPISSVTARRNELVVLGFVREKGKVVDPETHKTVIQWEVSA